MRDEYRFEISFNATDGFLARQCRSPECMRVFKVHEDSIRPSLHCPYCGIDFPDDELWTSDQAAFLDRFVDHKSGPEIDVLFSEMCEDAVKGERGWTFQRGSQHPRPPEPLPPPDHSVDSELTCPECETRFAVDGIFGYCPGCKSENLLLYDANLALIRRRLTSAADSERELRHAYTDLVSTFEVFCKREATRNSLPLVNFQNLVTARAAFREAGLDIYLSLSAEEDLALRRVFQKRHVFGHGEGIVDSAFIAAIPEDAELIGQRASLTPEELELGATAVPKAIEVLVLGRSASAGG
ncbi:MAG: hypothetical protein SFU57_04300 [Gemmatimonadales bacterium]|nr:hypothetical protein [Gemmatimonadales bacterium]